MQRQDAEKSRIILDLLESVGRDGQHSQRVRASEFGIALGLLNGYLKFCVRKGYIRIKRVPAQRYMYFLTPKGFEEKSRLAVLLLSNSFAFFRQARADCARTLKEAEARGWQRIVLAGATELAEICALCVLETDIEIVAVVDAAHPETHFLDLPVARSYEVLRDFDGVIVTDRFKPRESFDSAVALLGAQRVLAPPVLGIGK